MDQDDRTSTPIYEISRLDLKLDGLGTKIDAITSKLDTQNVSYEHRFTTLEVQGADAINRLGAIETDVSMLKTEHAVARSHIKLATWLMAAILTAILGAASYGLVFALHL